MPYTYTFVHLEVSEAAYEEIRQKLLAAGWDHAILAADRSDTELLDMNGIAIVKEPQSGSTVDPASKE